MEENKFFEKLADALRASGWQRTAQYGVLQNGKFYFVLYLNDQTPVVLQQQINPGTWNAMGLFLRLVKSRDTSLNREVTANVSKLSLSKSTSTLQLVKIRCTFAVPHARKYARQRMYTP